MSIPLIRKTLSPTPPPPPPALSPCISQSSRSGFYLSFQFPLLKVLEKCTKNLIGHSRLAFNNHESNIDC